MKKIAFQTLGCKVNQYETEAMITLFKNEGYEICDFNDICDIYVINTCAVTSMGERKSRQMIHRAHKINPDAFICVVGCYSQTNPEKVASIEGVNLVIGTKDRDKIVKLIKDKTNKEKLVNVYDILKERSFENLFITSYEDKTRAFVKIEDGCTEFCSYCIIPYARGPVRSRDIDSIIDEVKTLGDNGYEEIVLTGIHLASYGRDLKDVTLIDVIKQCAKVEKIKRIRLGSIEPRIITKEFVEVIKSEPKLCEHFHISLQSGCDKTLKAMNRKYTTEEYEKSVKLLKDAFGNCAITTDIITGFPGETDEDFNISLEFMKKIGFFEAHIFPYSEREGTKAVLLDGKVEKSVREKRAKIMIEKAKEQKEAFLKSFVGSVQEVLFERNTKDDIYEGHMSNYIKVKVKSPSDISRKMINVKITDYTGDYLIGDLE